MKPSICVLMTGFCLPIIQAEYRENKDAWVDRRFNLAPSCVAAVLFDVRQVTFSCTRLILLSILPEITCA